MNLLLCYIVSDQPFVIVTEREDVHVSDVARLVARFSSFVRRVGSSLLSSDKQHPAITVK